MTKTIFIAEDNPTNLKLVKDILEVKGYKTLEAADGKSAINKIIQNASSIDLILMDIQMPELSGIDAIKELKEKSDTKNIPIIVVSAQAMESDIKKAKKIGAVDYITKPINLVEFLNKVEKYTK